MLETRLGASRLDHGRRLWCSTRLWSVVVAATVLTAAGCSGDSSAPIASDSDTTVAPQSPSDSATVQPTNDVPQSAPSASTGDLRTDAVIETIAGAQAGEVSALVERIVIGQTVSYAGFDIEVTEVLIGFDPLGFAVAQVEMALTNRTPNRDRLQTAVEIESRGVVASIDRDVTPDVDSEATANGYVSVRLDPSFALDDAVLAIGRSDRNRTEIPLGSAGALVTRARSVIVDAGSGSDATSTIELTEVTSGWDLADPRTQSVAGEAFVVVRYSLESAVATAINDDVVVLRLPSGAEAAPIEASIRQVDAGVRVDDLTASFSVADPAAGPYVFVYSERFGNGTVEVPFTIG